MAKVLLVIPHDRFHDEELKTVFSVLKNSGHHVEIGSTHHTQAEGHYGLIVKPEVNVGDIEPIDYDALVFIGGRGAEELIKDETVLYKIRAYATEDKIVAALGMAVEILASSGILTARKVTCDTETITKIQYAGGFYSGGLTEEDGNIITGSGLAAKEEFAKCIVSALEYENRLRELRHARVARS